jgi:hypothetical protein
MKKAHRLALHSANGSLPALTRRLTRRPRSANKFQAGSSLVDSIYYTGPSVIKSSDEIKIVASKKIQFDEPSII